MNSKALILAVAAAAISAAILFALPAEALDSHNEESDEEREPFMMSDPFRNEDCPKPPRGDIGVPMLNDAFSGTQVPPEPIGSFDSPFGQDKFAHFDKPEMGPMVPEQQPRYEHDAEPEVLEANLEPMIEGDIRNFDPGFVADAIDFAEEQGMHDVAEKLRAKLASLLEYYMRSTSNINSANSRASGLDDEPTEDADIVVIEEDEEQEEDVPFFAEPLPSFYISFNEPFVQKSLQLSL